MVNGNAVDAYTSAVIKLLFKKKPEPVIFLKNASPSFNIRKIGTTI